MSLLRCSILQINCTDGICFYSLVFVFFITSFFPCWYKRGKRGLQIVVIELIFWTFFPVSGLSLPSNELANENILTFVCIWAISFILLQDCSQAKVATGQLMVKEKCFFDVSESKGIVFWVTKCVKSRRLLKLLYQWLNTQEKVGRNFTGHLDLKDEKRELEWLGGKDGSQGRLVTATVWFCIDLIREILFYQGKSGHFEKWKVKSL